MNSAPTESISLHTRRRHGATFLRSMAFHTPKERHGGRRVSRCQTEPNAVPVGCDSDIVQPCTGFRLADFESLPHIRGASAQPNVTALSVVGVKGIVSLSTDPLRLRFPHHLQSRVPLELPAVCRRV